MHTQLVNSVNQPFYNVSDDSKFKVYTTVRHTSHFNDKIVLFRLLVCVFPASSQLISAASYKDMLHKTTEAPASLAECFGFFFHLSGLLLRVPGESAESSARRPPRPTRTAPFFLKYQLLVGLLYRITSWKLTSLEPVSWARLGNYPSRDVNHRTGRDRFIQVKVLRRCCKNFQQECQTEINKYIIK